MEKVELVIHLAADMDFFPPKPELMYAVRYPIAIKKILQYCSEISNLIWIYL